MSSSSEDADRCKGVPCGHPYLPFLEVGPCYAAKALAGQCGPAPLLLDCRREEEVAAVCIAGSLNIPLDELAARTCEVEQAMLVIGAVKTDMLLVMCHHGRRSLLGANMLKAAGFMGARSVVGGIDLWARTIDTTLSRYEKCGSDIRII